MNEQFGMRTRAALIFVLLLSLSGWAASGAKDSESTDALLPVFRVTTGEVHVAITAVTRHNEAVTDLSASDFTLLRDGEAAPPIVSFEKRTQVPVSALILTDVSDSMKPGLALERSAADWLKQNSDSSRDHLQLLDFGMEVSPTDEHRRDAHLTSLYDSLVQTIPLLAEQENGRRVLILLTDGDDNSSYHALTDAIELAQQFDVAIYAITACPSKKQWVQDDVLQQLTESTGGRAYRARNEREMTAALSQIRNELTTGYELVFRPDEASPGMHRLSIRSVNRNLRFFYRTAYYQPEAPTVEYASR